MATPATSNSAESTDTARLAHGRVRKKFRRKSAQLPLFGPSASAMPGPEYRHVSVVQAALGDCFQAFSGWPFAPPKAASPAGLGEDSAEADRLRREAVARLARPN